MRASSRTCGLSSSPRRGTPVTRLKCIRYMDSGRYASIRSMEAMSWSGSNCEGGVVGVMKAPRSVSSAR